MKTFFSGFSKGLSDYSPAVRFIFKHQLAWVYLVPIVLNILLFAGMWTAISIFSNDLQAMVSHAASLNSLDFWGAETLQWIINFSIALVLHILFFFVFAYTGGYIVVILLSPILAYVSEKTEKILTGKDFSFSIHQLMRDIVRGALIALRNLALELLIMLAFFIFSFIPFFGWLVGLVSPIILFVVASYFYGFSFVDYVSERQKLNLKKSILFVKEKRGIVTGNGMPFALVLLVPYIGLLFSGLVAITASVAAVISITNSDQIEKNRTQVNTINKT